MDEIRSHILNERFKHLMRRGFHKALERLFASRKQAVNQHLGGCVRLFRLALSFFDRFQNRPHLGISRVPLALLDQGDL